MFGVIARVQSEASKAELVMLSGLGARTDSGRPTGTFDPRSTTEVTTSAAYWKAVQAEVGTALDIDALQAADLRSWSRIDPEMVGPARSARRGDRLGLLSNITPELADEYERTHAWLDVFDVLGFSSRIGHAKPSRQAFEWCLDRFGVPTGDILFIDDSPANLVTADAMGLRTHLFTGIDELRRTLGQPAS